MNSISRYESGIYNLSLDLIERIANGIGVTVEVLVC
ncbi:helix-turn-helix domain-containing protein [Edaphocola flava]|nr:helix-turn-helix transcriptional regulator [Edaphocola flava]